MMFQDPYASLDPRMRVQTILREPLVIQKVGTRQEQDQKIRQLLEEVGLPQNALERYPHEFSGGQRQRIALARALMLEPKVIVADEPVSALDVSIRSQVLNLMKRLQAEHQRASMVISHDLAVVKYLADRIAVMYLGKVVELGTGDDIYRRPAHPYTDALIKTIPVPDPAAERAKTEVGIRGRASQPDRPAVRMPFQDPLPRAQALCGEQEPVSAPVRADAAGGVPFPAAGARGHRAGRRSRRRRLGPSRPDSGPARLARDPHRLQDERLDLSLVANRALRPDGPPWAPTPSSGRNSTRRAAVSVARSLATHLAGSWIPTLGSCTAPVTSSAGRGPAGRVVVGRVGPHARVVVGRRAGRPTRPIR